MGAQIAGTNKYHTLLRLLPVQRVKGYHFTKAPAAFPAAQTTHTRMLLIMMLASTANSRAELPESFCATYRLGIWIGASREETGCHVGHSGPAP